MGDKEDENLKKNANRMRFNKTKSLFTSKEIFSCNIITKYKTQKYSQQNLKLDNNIMAAVRRCNL